MIIHVELNNDFIVETYKTWRFLLKNRLIYDLVDSDSRKRENKKIKYKKVKWGIDDNYCYSIAYGKICFHGERRPQKHEWKIFYPSTV